jgi:hypothetical protein
MVNYGISRVDSDTKLLMRPPLLDQWPTGLEVAHFVRAGRPEHLLPVAWTQANTCHDGARPRRAMVMTRDEVGNAFSSLAELVSAER